MEEHLTKISHTVKNLLYQNTVFAPTNSLVHNFFIILFMDRSNNQIMQVKAQSIYFHKIYKESEVNCTSFLVVQVSYMYMSSHSIWPLTDFPQQNLVFSPKKQTQSVTVT